MNRRRRLDIVFAAALATLVVSTSDVARADESSAPPPVPTRSYAWQTLAVDGAGLAATGGIIAGAVAGDHDSNGWVAPSLLASSAVYVLGAPAIHLAHDRGSAAGTSVALRVISPVAGILVGGSIGFVGGLLASGCKLNDSGCRNEKAGTIVFASGLGVGALIGLGVPIVIDALYLAREPVPATPSPQSARSVKPKVVPRVDVLPNGGGFAGVAGTF